MEQQIQILKFNSAELLDSLQKIPEHLSSDCVYKTKNVDDWQSHAPGPLYVLLYFDPTCLPYSSWLQLQPVTVLPLGVGMGYSKYFAQRLSGPTDFSTIQSRRW